VNILLLAVLQDEATVNVVHVLDVVLSVVFIVDFLVRLRRAPSRPRYFWRGTGGRTCSRACRSPR
jgi:voltage-gated potassium channel